MRLLLGLLVLGLNTLDNLTTYLSLSRSAPGFEVFEANPFARWLFDSIGLAEGLLFETVITTLAVGFLVYAPRISPRLRMGLLVGLALLPAWATLNNLGVMHAVGIAAG